MPTDVTFRAARWDDEPALHRVMYQAVDDDLRRSGRRTPEEPAPNDEKIRQSFDQLRDLIRYVHDAGTTWVAEAGGELVGYARTVTWQQTTQLTEAMVLPAFQQGGVGVELLLRTFGSREIPEDTLRIVRANPTTKAVGLYTRFGVVPTEIENGWSVPGDAAREAAKRVLQGSRARYRPLTLDDLPAIDRLDLRALGFSRTGLHEAWIRSGRIGILMSDRRGPAGYCYGGETFGPGAGRTPYHLPPLVAAAIHQSPDAQQFGLSLPGASTAWFRWILDLGPRVAGFGALMSSRPLPGLDRYVLSREDKVL